MSDGNLKESNQSLLNFLLGSQQEFIGIYWESPDYTDYEAITQITNTLKNKEKSVESFFESV